MSTASPAPASSPNAAEPLTATSTAWRGQPSVLIRGNALEAIVTCVGANLACLRSIGDDLNPLWQPDWPAADPRRIHIPADGSPGPYGAWPRAPLHAAIVGSNLCIDRFGDPWPGERKPLHGEAGVVPWQLTTHADHALFTTILPEARLQLRRSIAFAGEMLILRTAVCHDELTPRAIDWCEHTTLGDPFLDGADITAGIDWAARWRSNPDRIDPLPTADALRLPRRDDPPTGSIVASRVAQGFWQADHRGFRRRLRAEFDPREFPWLALWTEHRNVRVAPWHGRQRTRGMEVSTKPIPDGKPPAERATHWQGRPTVCTVPPGRWLEKTVRLTWTRLSALPS